MKLLPFERALQIESRPCPRCVAKTAYFPDECYSCGDWRRVPTKAGRELLIMLADILGGPVPIKDNRRFDDSALRNVFGRDLRRGMRVKAVAGFGEDKYREIASIEDRPMSRTVTFTDGFALSATEHRMFYRELSEKELAKADAFLAANEGNGAVRAE